MSGGRRSRCCRSVYGGGAAWAHSNPPGVGPRRGGMGGSPLLRALSPGGVGARPAVAGEVMGHSPAVTGVVIGAQSVSWMFAAFAAGRLMIRTSYRLTAVIGGLSLLFGAVMLTMLAPETDPFWPAAAGFVMGIGMGFCNTT